jgi:septal ring factor EnvC (AmiA/AmiB activator)
MSEKSKIQVLKEYLPWGALLLALGALTLAWIGYNHSQQVGQQEGDFLTRSEYRDRQEEISAIDKKLDKLNKEQEKINTENKAASRQQEKKMTNLWQQLEETVSDNQLSSEEAVDQQQEQLRMLREAVDILQRRVTELQGQLAEEQRREP